MDRVRIILLDNIRNVARLEQYPTHQLRVVNQASCLPEILHESRMFSSFVRLLSGDSRRIVLAAIEQTLRFVTEGVHYSAEFQQDIVRHKDRFERGMAALQTHYERDMYVTMVIDRILYTWRLLVLSFRQESALVPFI